MTPEQEALLREADERDYEAAPTEADLLIDRLARELRAALADSERLDWIEQNASVSYPLAKPTSHGLGLRAAIDAAIDAAREKGSGGA